MSDVSQQSPAESSQSAAVSSDTSAAKPKPQKPKLKALVERDACTGCEYCVHWCPVPECLVMKEGERVEGVLQIVHVNVETCIGCKLCEQNCPYDAIHVHKLAPEEIDAAKPLEGVIPEPFHEGLFEELALPPPSAESEEVSASTSA